MSAEMFAKIMQNSERDDALVEQSPRQPPRETESEERPRTRSDMMLQAISNMLLRRRQK